MFSLNFLTHSIDFKNSKYYLCMKDESTQCIVPIHFCVHADCHRIGYIPYSLIVYNI